MGMKRGAILYLAAACSALATGCHHCAKCDRVSTGWRFEVLRPPVVEQSAPMLIQQSPGYLSMQSMGAVAGPIAGGQFYSAPGLQLAPQAVSCTPPPQMPYAAPPPPQAPAAAPSCMSGAAAPAQAPAAAPARMTCEEWCELMRETARQRRLPMPFKQKQEQQEE
jgi:hypothetical protein